jgi:hypothetical protein
MFVNLFLLYQFYDEYYPLSQACLKYTTFRKLGPFPVVRCKKWGGGYH